MDWLNTIGGAVASEDLTEEELSGRYREYNEDFEGEYNFNKFSKSFTENLKESLSNITPIGWVLLIIVALVFLSTLFLSGNLILV